MAAARTMQVGLLLAILGSARATCLKPGYDMGDSANSCGYAPEVKDLDSATDCQALCLGAGADYFAYDPVKVFGGPGYDFSAHSWIASKGITTEAVGAADELDSAMDCQALCLGAGADYFAYEPGQLCVCKEIDGYSDASCVLYGLNAGAPDITSGPTQCPGCIMDGYDAAGSANICGYAVEVKIVATTGYDFSEPSWIATKGIPTAHTDNLRTPYDCRMLCMAETGCAFFAFDAMKQPGKGFCVLKQAYSHPSCEPQYGADDDIASGPLLCKSTIKCGMLDDACCD
ncbi:unnamed protein product [Prorocentrum cordatum]|uniref:Apple domain-containing protein n=1 Tax=Prorocentrum cordatum TaxID=2364126 RepID=A0ABN9XAQ7_9DINO|nr:unnamed protein product [Polarella glacialis]